VLVGTLVELVGVIVELVGVVVEGLVVVLVVVVLVPVTELYASDVAFLVEFHQDSQNPPLIFL
jgi:hypothetical protein